MVNGPKCKARDEKNAAIMKNILEQQHHTLAIGHIGSGSSWIFSHEEFYSWIVSEISKSDANLESNVESRSLAEFKSNFKMKIALPDVTYTMDSRTSTRIPVYKRTSVSYTHLTLPTILRV